MKKILTCSCLSLCLITLGLTLGVVAYAQTPAPAAAPPQRLLPRRLSHRPTLNLRTLPVKRHRWRI